MKLRSGFTYGEDEGTNPTCYNICVSTRKTKKKKTKEVDTLTKTTLAETPEKRTSPLENVTQRNGTPVLRHVCFWCIVLTLLVMYGYVQYQYEEECLEHNTRVLEEQTFLNWFMDYLGFKSNDPRECGLILNEVWQVFKNYVNV